MKPTLLATATLAALALLVGCNGGGDAKTETGGAGATAEAPKDAGKKLKIAVIPKGSTHEFWKSIHEGASKAEAELGNVEIVWKGPLNEGDREDQIKIVENMIATGVNGIVLAPLDDAALMKPVEEAAAQDIPTLVIDSPLKEGSKAIGLVATDNLKGGTIAAQEMCKLLNDKGSVMILKYQEGSASTTLRENGFLDEIKKHPGIKLVRGNDYAGDTEDKAQKISENMIQAVRQGDKLGVDGIYCVNESSTFGMLRALEDAGVAGKVRFIGFDASPKLIDGLRAGKIDGLIVQDPRKMGYLGVKAMVAKLRGETTETNVDTGVTYVTKAKLDTPEVAELVAPPKN